MYMSPSKDHYHFPVRKRHVAVTVLATAVAFWQWRRRRRRLDDAKRASSPPRLRRKISPKPSARLGAKIDFLERSGGEYGYADSKKGFIDDWRPFEFPTLILPSKLPPRFFRPRTSSQFRRDHCDRDVNAIPECDGGESPEPEVYLDYAGSAIPTRTLLSRISSCESQILANPHSRGGGLASDRTLKMIQLTRDRVMRHFGIPHETNFNLEESDEEDENQKADENKHAMPRLGYQLIFTSGATESLRLVAERFPWTSLRFEAEQRKSRIALDNHGNARTSRPNAQGSMGSSKRTRIRSVRAQSIFLFPRNVHTSVIGMRQIALSRGARFRCVSVDELLGATSEWFRELTEGSTSCEYQEAKGRDRGCDDEEGGSDRVTIDCSGQSENTAVESTSSRRKWVHHLLVLPLECNFGGDRFDWSRTTAAARELSFSSHLHCSSDDRKQSTNIRISHKWHILFDTAKAAATSPVNLPNLAQHAGGPDFAVVSFYKIFGAPTGLGALFVKKHRRRKLRGTRVAANQIGTNGSHATETSCPTTSHMYETDHHSSGGIIVERKIPQRQFFGGGSVDVVLSGRDYMVPRNSEVTNPVHGGVSNDEDDENIDLGVMVHGTEHFRGIASLAHGFRELDDLGGMEAISSHSTCLAVELARRLGKLLHDTGKPVVHLYGHWKSVMNNENSCLVASGPTVTFNIFDRDGLPIGYDEVSRLASLERPPIQLRTGCFCNPGACQDALSLTDADVLENYSSGHVCGDRRGIVNDKLTGAIRASFGKDSLWEDVDALASFVGKVFVSRGQAFVASHSSEELETISSDSDATMKIDSVFVFPIKSCAAMRVKRWPIDRQTGRLAFDREFALVDTSGSAMRLHSYPKMSAIHSDIDLNTKTLTATAPGHEDLILNLENATLSADHTMSSEDVQVCGALCKGSIWGGIKAARWFSSVLGVRCWLARHYAGETDEISDGNNRYAYCNEASLLLISQQSVSFLNSVITAQGWGRLVEPRHFRPNIVLSSNFQGGNVAKKLMDEKQKATNPEDSWRRIVIEGRSGVVELTAVGKCARCQMVDIDPSSGMKGNTLRALAQYRRDRGQINFGTFFTGNMDSSEGNYWVEEGSEVHTSSKISKEESS